MTMKSLSSCSTSLPC